MFLLYNDVLLQMTEMLGYSREAVYDSSGTDLLYVKHTLNVVATVAPGGYPAATSIALDQPAIRGNRQLAGTAGDMKSTGARAPALQARGKDPTVYRFPDGTRGIGVLAAGGPAGVGDRDIPVAGMAPGPPIANSAFMTEMELRQRLLIPRKKLLITAFRPSGDSAEPIVWLESPRPITAQIPILGRTYGTFTTEPVCDAANGPIPLQLNVLDPAGTGMSLGVNFQISTCLVPVEAASERLVLSHRWEVTHQHDKDYYMTRIINGEIVFNGGMYRQMQVIPSDLLSQLFHPIPLGFKRLPPVVTQSADGLVIRYQVADQDTPIVFDPGDSGATQISIVESLNYLQPSALLGSIL